MKKIILILVAVAAGVLIVSNLADRATSGSYHYVITETSLPTSLDPLDGDQTQNLSVQRMIYATPVEVDAKGSLESQVLESFSYSPENRTMTWTLKPGAKFSNGSAVTIEDVAFAVSRMAYTRPKFPIIDKIEGVQDWVKNSNALESNPSGIKISGNTVEIKFAEPVDHPLFRFCLEIFSIIPKSCVNLKTNKITCDKIPFSGHYAINDQTKSQINFELRDSSPLKGIAPHKISFEYQLPDQAFAEGYKFNGVTVIQGNEIKLSLEQLKSLKNKFQTSYLPSARIGLTLLNPNFAPFNSSICRMFYADAYRQAFESLETVGFKVESSVFTDVLPGYMKSEEIGKATISQMTDNEKSKCLQQLRETPPQWAIVKEDAGSIYSVVTEKTFEVLGIPKPEPKVFDTRKQETEAFVKGEISVLGASTGFWAMDPAGDIQMLLTPNMHKILQFVANDDRVQNLIRSLKVDGEKNNPEAFKKLNQYIHDQALFNVFAHVRRFYSSNSLENIADLPVSITSPAPWQVFRMK